MHANTAENQDPADVFTGDSLTGENAAYLEGLEEAGPRGPSTAPRSIFHGGGATAGSLSGGSLSRENAASAKAPMDAREAVDRQAKVARLVNAHRVHGHRAAQLDPLGQAAPEVYQELQPEYYGLSDADLDVVVSTSPLYGIGPYATVRKILAHLRDAYCGSIGVEYMNIRDAEQKHWVTEQFEARGTGRGLDKEGQIRALEMLTRADGFERYLGLKFMGYKRFSLEGGESLIPLLDQVIEAAAEKGVREVVIGMAHRGRLNVLLNVLQKPPMKILSEFSGQVDDDGHGSGDVKYHLGYSSNRTTRGGTRVHVSLCFNPSHLEAVDPVCEGRVRAKQDRFGDTERVLAMPLLIHGDAAFAGQGIVTETLNLSDLRGYRTGGTIHVVVNNQIGFTTSPRDSRSTPYSTDVARMLGVPIFHVNGEDPEAVAHAVRIAVDWRFRYKQDAVIDMYCYRRWGHNETDEPAFTQPLMYKKIAEHPGVREAYLRQLVAGGVVTHEDGDVMMRKFHGELDAALSGVTGVSNGHGSVPSQLQGLWAGYHSGRADEVDTSQPIERLQSLLARLSAVPEGFAVHPKLQRIFKQREDFASGAKALDWAAAELLAYATLVTQGSRVRLSGQDCGRGTFSHRHAELLDQNTGERFVPLANLEPGQAPFEVFNSHLSEAAVLGFEFGYSLDFPEALVIWEAQFGDFANGAQVIIDNFLTSSESKWNRLSGLTLFLPHGYEGQGPEHSSARIERFLQMAAEENIQICNCTTPAQMYHLLRRQVLRKVRDPLVVFTPKSLLRHPQVVSPLTELASGRFETVIGDGEGRNRLVFCSGKVYYDLLAAREDRDVTICRVEQLYPFPLARIQAEIERHPGAEVVWCQEEPANMGPWSFVVLQLLEAGIQVKYAGRKASASPATGYPARHAAQQKQLVAEALGIEGPEKD